MEGRRPHPAAGAHSLGRRLDRRRDGRPRRGGRRGGGGRAARRRLGTTKGSFYHHFASRDALITAALEEWERRDTTDVRRAPPADRRSARADPRGDDGGDHRPGRRPPGRGAPGVGVHPLVAPVVARATAERIRYLTDTYMELGLPRARARRRALLTSAAYVGLFDLARSGGATVSDAELRAYADEMLAALVPGAGGGDRHEGPHLRRHRRDRPGARGRSLERGMDVSAFVRDPAKLGAADAGLRVVAGELDDTEVIAAAVAGRTRWSGPSASGRPLRSDPAVIRGVARIVDAMERGGPAARLPLVRGRPREPPARGAAHPPRAVAGAAERGRRSRAQGGAHRARAPWTGRSCALRC